jgi:hypothetical protein
LAAIALPYYLNFTIKAKRAETFVVLQHVHHFEMAYFSGHDHFYHPCGQTNEKNCMAISGTASDPLVIQFNKTLGLGENLTKTKFGYNFTYWFRRNDSSEPWINYTCWLANSTLDSDPITDQVVIHYDHPFLNGIPNGIPYVLIDDFVAE